MIDPAGVLTITKMNSMTTEHAALYSSPDISIREGADGVLYMASNAPLPEGPPSLCDYLYRWAEQRPNTVFLAERHPDDRDKWRTQTYREFLDTVERLAQSLQSKGLSADKPLMILSGNSLEHAQLTFAAMLIGVPVVPVSPSYSLLSETWEKVLHIAALTGAGAVFAQQQLPFRGVLSALRARGLDVITADKEPSDDVDMLLDELISVGSPGALERPEVGPDTVAKILFTSGSTGMPKGVITTHRMVVSVQEMMSVVWPFINEPEHVLLDWLPWHHCFGGSHNLYMMLRNGGSMYIDGGKATPDGVLETLRNLKQVSPTVVFNVPAGYDLLVNALEADKEACDGFFRNLRLMFFAAAALPEAIRARIEALVHAHAPRPIPLTSSWGQTETSPGGTTLHFDCATPNNIGVPLPGVELKLVPTGDLVEARIRGPSVTPGYLNDPEKTAESFDEEGFFKSGDAVALQDPADPNQGLIFRGRVSENFKLFSGTWVNVGQLRVALVSALAPLATDAVICGQGQREICALVFPNAAVCAVIGGEGWLTSTVLREAFVEKLQAFNAENTASSRRIARILLQAVPPSLDRNETTDKGYINQRGVLSNRAADVARLYAENLDAEIIVP